MEKTGVVNLFWSKSKELKNVLLLFLLCSNIVLFVVIITSNTKDLRSAGSYQNLSQPDTSNNDSKFIKPVDTTVKADIYGTYKNYKHEFHTSPDNLWMVSVEYLSDFSDRCEIRTNISTAGDYEILRYRENDGWRGDYLGTCDSYVDSVFNWVWTSEFSGWSDDSKSFYFTTRISEGEKEVLYASLVDGIWKVRGFAIKGDVVGQSRNLERLLVSNTAKEDQLSLYLYNNSGKALQVLETTKVYTPRYKKLGYSDRIIAMIPASEQVENSNNQDVHFYLIDLVESTIKQLGQSTRELIPGPPCDALNIIEKGDNTVVVSGECLATELTLTLK